MSSASLSRLSSCMAVLAVMCAVPALHAQKKSSPPPAKSAPAPKPAASHTGAPAGAAHGASTPGAGHSPTTTASHGPTTSGPTTAGMHGPTTSGPSTMGHTAGGTRTGGFGGNAAHPALAERGPMSHPGAVNAHEVRTAGGGAVRMRADGHAADLHDPHRGMDIHHNLVGGNRRVAMERADHSRLVYERGRRGYIGHPYMYHGHEFSRRSYYWHGRAYNRFYSPYYYHGVHFDVYAPYRYYSPGFYGWAYNPWRVPVSYAWGWGPSPWYGYYGGYFTPYPVYASSSLWLTDYMISQSLQASYEEAAASGTPAPMAADYAPLTPDVKQMVADEVQRQLALENSEAQLNTQGQPPDPSSSSIARMLSDGQPHAFIAGSEVDVVDSSGQECAITDGDVLVLKMPPAPDAAEAQLTVMSSKGGKECHKMEVVSVSLEDLQEMQNHMRETVDQGLGDLQAKQGKGGLPTAPPSALTTPVNSAIAADAPAPDPAGEKELSDQAQQADQAEQEMLKSAGGPSDAAAAAAPAPVPPPVAPVSVDIQPGQSIAQVKAAMGEPVRIMNLGPKTIYVYKDIKVTFKAGKVSDIE